MAGLATKNPPLKKKPLESPKLESYLSLIFFFASLFIAFSLFSYDDGEYGAQNNLFGRLGNLVSWILFFLLGRSAFQIPFFLFGFGFLFFQKKEANLKNLLYGLGFVLIAGAVYANLFEKDITSLKHGGGKLGTWTSEILEYFVGKSGRVLLALAAYIFGIILIAKEFPKEINKQLWLKIYFKIKERLFRMAIPKANLASEIQDGTQEIPIKNYDLPWIEIKKVPVDWKFATSKTFSSETNYRTSAVTEIKEEDTETIANNILERTKNFFETIKSSRPITKLFKKTEKIETPTVETSTSSETSKEQVEDLSIQLPEISKTLKEKIYGAPLPSTETMEALSVKEEVLGKESSNSVKEIDEHVTPEELEMLFANDSSDVHEEQEIQQAQESVTDSNESKPSDYDALVKLAEKEEEKNSENWQEKSSKTEEEKSYKLPLLRTTVPKINFLRKTQYKISHKHLATNLEKKPNPMFRLEAEYTARKIEEIIKEYGYESKVTTWQKGPIITRYEVAPPTGVKLGKITSLSDELKLYLAVKSIRIVAPIPGKSTIGIEVPNKFREQVLLGDILREKTESVPNGDLLITLGKDSISGETVYIDLNKLPHLLIAGTTGSGKSVSLNSMISYLIMTKSPAEVRFVMIDPKMVEMSLYENIPHLLMPVITDPRKATKALYWAVQEMESRYAMISEIKCRDIKAYNEKVNTSLLAQIYTPMPYIVIFIDELSDLMMVAGKELEDSITRLSQKARAVGIHLVMATQRPSVDVITGLIKANCPARLAFHVAQKNDSKIILDYSGADTLLGKGDSLYKSPTSPDLQRIQAPFITEEEIEKIVEEAISFAKPSYVDINLEEDIYKEETSLDADEAEFEEAWNIVRTERKASASYLQRRMRIGYNKAARLMEMMEERGYVGPQIGSKPREILR